MKLLIWDFDGTLGYREGGAWTASLFEVVQREAPERVAPRGTVTFEQLRPYANAGFPWHAPEVPHLHLATPDLWWASLVPLFERAYLGVGFEGAQARALAHKVRATYLNPARWRRYDDVVPALEKLSVEGWTHVLLSNHVPELPALMQTVGLTSYFARVFNSAELGYEKPHPRLFEMVLDEMHVSPADCESGDVWMIGDSYRADIQGAEAAGIPAILVRRYHPDAVRFAETPATLPEMLE